MLEYKKRGFDVFSIFSSNKLTSTESLDIIEKNVYEYLKPLGFKKYGRTLHRFVDGDISQVINFQNGCPSKGVFDILWINLGIRVPECANRKFIISEPIKKYYHEYECNIRTRLGSLVDKSDTYYDLRKEPQRIANDIIDRLEKYVLPVFEVLNSRDNILKHRAEHADFDQMNNHMILLEEAMIWGRRGNLSESSRLYNLYYQDKLAEYNYDVENGTQTYLRKGERLVYKNSKTNKTETVTATKNGYVTTYSANKSHILYLEELAKELGVVVYKH